jgi:hypothetical protein
MHLSIAPALRLYFGMSVSDQGTFGGVTQFANHPPELRLQTIDSKGRDGRVVDGARLESDSGDAHGGTQKHAVVQSIRPFTPFRYALM